MYFGFRRVGNLGVFPGDMDVFVAQNLVQDPVESETNASISDLAREALSEKASEEESEIVQREIVPISSTLEEVTGLKHDLPEEELSAALTRTASLIEPILPEEIQKKIDGLSFDEIVEQTVLKKWGKPNIIRHLWAVKEESQALKLINVMDGFDQRRFCEELVDERNFTGLFEVVRFVTDPFKSDLAKRCIAVNEMHRAIKLLSMIENGLTLLAGCRNLLLLRFVDEAVDLATNCLRRSNYKCEFFYDVYNTGYRGEKLFELALSIKEDCYKAEICCEFIDLLDCSKLLEVAYSIKYRSEKVEKIINDLIDSSLC